MPDITGYLVKKSLNIDSTIKKYHTKWKNNCLSCLCINIYIEQQSVAGLSRN